MRGKLKYFWQNRVELLQVYIWDILLILGVLAIIGVGVAVAVSRYMEERPHLPELARPAPTAPLPEVAMQIRVPTPPSPERDDVLGFVVIVQVGRPVIYEAVKGPVRRVGEDQYAYTNSEGTPRQFAGIYFYSAQPFKLTEQPVIRTPTSDQFRGN